MLPNRQSLVEFSAEIKDQPDVVPDIHHLVVEKLGVVQVAHGFIEPAERDFAVASVYPQASLVRIRFQTFGVGSDSVFKAPDVGLSFAQSQHQVDIVGIGSQLLLGFGDDPFFIWQWCTLSGKNHKGTKNTKENLHE